MQRLKYKIVSTFLIFAGLYWLVAQHSPKPIEPPKALPTATILNEMEIQRITYYQAVPAQTDDTPKISACGPNIDNQIAVSRDLFKASLQCGDKVQVWSDEHGYLGTFTVWDTMNERFAKTVDILTVNPYHWGKTKGYIVIEED